MAEFAIGSEIDPRAFRRALGNFATGVTVITARGPDGTNVGVTASSFNSLSIDPPLVLWSSIKEARSCAIFEASTHFAVNILAADQMDMSNHFARQQEDKFATVEFEEGIAGAPIFPHCAGRFQCETYNKVDGGDHWIFIGKVVAFDDFGRAPLCFHQGSYSMLIGHPGSRPKSDDHAVQGTTGQRMRNHTFFLMMMAVRAYQSRYQPKLEALDLSLIESRSLLVLSDQPGLDAEGLVVHVNSPITEVVEALANLEEQGFVLPANGGFALTASGQEKADQCWNLSDAHAVEAFKEFGDERVADFRNVLRQLIDQ